METEQLLTLEDSYGLNVYPKRDLVLVRGEGALLFDNNNRIFIDCAGGHGVASVGHGNPIVAKAIGEQAKKLISCPGIFYNDLRAQLLAKLIGVSPRNIHKAFLCNSGTESVEAALKFARFTTKRPNFVCMMRGFHGRTMGALSATFNPNYKKDFEPLVPGFSFAPFNNIEKTEKLVDENCAAVILETVQGEGGVHVAQKEFIREVRRICDKKGALLIVDEVQTGFCRTGRFFSIQHFDVEADMICIAKAMGGGIPMGAVLCSDKIIEPKGKHGSTFGGNPLCCAAASAVIDYMMENNLATQAQQKGQLVMDRLSSADSPRIRQVRGLGLMIGIELKEKVKPIVLELMKQGVLTLPAGATVLRLLPPLVITKEELEIVAEKIIKVLG